MIFNNKNLIVLHSTVKSFLPVDVTAKSMKQT